MTSMRRRFRGLFGLDPVHDVEAEMSFHLDMRIRELIERGESPERARALALQRFGDYDASRRACVDIDTRRRRSLLRQELISDRIQDVRYAIRMFRRSPGFTAVAVLTLALGIGSNAAVFSMFDRVLLQPLRVVEPDRLVNLAAPGPKPGPKYCGGVMGDCDGTFSYPMFRDLEQAQHDFVGLAAHRDFEATLGHLGQAVTGAGLFVSGQYFSTLGVRPVFGRLLGPDDDRTVGAADVAVLSYRFWRNRTGARAEAVGTTISVNGTPMTIVGVAEPGFEGTTRGFSADVFVPVTMRWRLQPWPSGAPDNRRAYWLYLFARLKPGVTLEQARVSLDPTYRAIINGVEAPLQEGLTDQTMRQFKTRTLRIEPGSRGQSGLLTDVRPAFILVLAVTGLMLIITCLNVANLLLTHTAPRAKEVATRLSLGATRARLVAQLLTECLVLAIAGACVSFAVTRATLWLLRPLLPPELPLHFDLDTTFVAATAMLALAVTLAIGLLPALHAVRHSVVSALKNHADQRGGGRTAARFRTTLATIQVGVSMVLVVLALLFTRSLANITRVDPVVQPDGLVMFSVAPQRSGYTPARAATLFQQLREELAALPGVSAVSSSTTPLLADNERVTSVFVERVDATPATDNSSRYDEVGDGYFRTLGIPLMAGREFTASDSVNAPNVAIVNEQFVRKFGLERAAVGRRMSVETPTLDTEIVGVVKNFPHSSFRDAAAPMYFVPFRQGTKRPGFMIFFVRTSLGTDQLMGDIRSAVFRLDRNLPIETARTMHDTIRGATGRERLMGVMIGAFAVLALLVAAVGLYGVLAYTVSQRTAEIGLRMALGATRTTVRWMVLRHMTVISVGGGALGMTAALVLGQAAQTMLFGLKAHDPSVLAAATLVLLAVATLAAVIPADRAARIDPNRALKYE